jgi:hypothetical protein
MTASPVPMTVTSSDHVLPVFVGMVHMFIYVSFVPGAVLLFSLVPTTVCVVLGARHAFHTAATLLALARLLAQDTKPAECPPALVDIPLPPTPPTSQEELVTESVMEQMAFYSGVDMGSDAGGATNDAAVCRRRTGAGGAGDSGTDD